MNWHEIVNESGYFNDSITKKQVNVIFMNNKNGNIIIPKVVMTWLYNDVADTSSYITTKLDERYAQFYASDLKEALNLLFSKDYKKAEKIILDCYKRYKEALKKENEIEKKKSNPETKTINKNGYSFEISNIYNTDEYEVFVKYNNKIHNFTRKSGDNLKADSLDEAVNLATRLIDKFIKDTNTVKDDYIWQY